MRNYRPILSAVLLAAAVAAGGTTLILAGLARTTEPAPPTLSIDIEQMTRDAKPLPEQRRHDMH